MTLARIIINDTIGKINIVKDYIYGGKRMFDNEPENKRLLRMH